MNMPEAMQKRHDASVKKCPLPHHSNVYCGCALDVAAKFSWDEAVKHFQEREQKLVGAVKFYADASSLSLSEDGGDIARQALKDAGVEL